MFYETTFTIDSRDLDCFGVCRPSRLLGYLQETAAQAIHQLDADNVTMVARYGCCWMVSRLCVTLDAPLRWQDELTLKTWHRGGEKAILYRDTDLSVNGVPIGQALAAWILVERDTRRLRRLSAFPELTRTDGGALNRQSALSALKPPSTMPIVQRRGIYYSDLDDNGHVNNTRYADFFCDAIPHTFMQGRFLRQLQLDYLHECRLGQELILRAAGEENRWFVSGEDPAEGLHFQGQGLFA